MIISVIIASLITISLSASITDIQSQSYKPETLQNDLNQIKTEIKKITSDSTITDKEKRNFKEMLQYYESYNTEATFNNSEPCIQVTLESTEETIQMPCIN